MCAQLHAAAGVCHRSGCGVTLTNPRSKFCSSACRQAAYRTGPTHAARLENMCAARKLRRARFEQYKYRASSLHQYRGFGGPVPAGMPPRRGGLDLKPFLREAKAVANA
jgi:hypothetical protein